MSNLKACKCGEPTCGNQCGLCSADESVASKPEPMTDDEWLGLLLRKAPKDILHTCAFVGDTIQTQGRWVLYKHINDLRKFIETYYGFRPKE